MRTPALDARVGRVLGKYTLLRVIGEGGMAVVYEAVHRNGNRVALKLLRPEVSLGADVRARFVREGYAANKVGHGAVRILDDDERDGLAFLVMELLDGVTLDGLARGEAESEGARRPRRPVPPALACAIGAHVLDTLVHAHAAGVVHRDIKPENVFLERKGSVKLLDFGIARVALPGETSSTVTGRVLGTPAFVSPEQAYGRRVEVDARSDVYAVGATLFTILSGRLVHEAESPEEALILAATENAPKLGAVMQVHPAIADVVDRALSHRRDDRWPSAEAMAEALRSAHRVAFDAEVPASLDFGIAAQAEDATTTGIPHPRRRRSFAAGAMALGAVSLVAVVVSALTPSRGPTPEATTVDAAVPTPVALAQVPTSALATTAPPSGVVAPAATGEARAAVSPTRVGFASTRLPQRAVAPSSTAPATCGVDIDEEGRKWPRRCP